MTIHAKPMSETRARLAHLIEQRNEAKASLDSVAAKVNRLESLADARSPAEEDLAALDAKESHAMAAWAERADGSEPPKPDARRERLRREIEASRQSAESARRAANSLAGERQRAAERLALAGKAMASLAAELLLEPLEAVSERARRAVAEIAAARTEVRAILDYALSLADRSPEARGPFMAKYASAADRAAAAFALPLPDEDGADYLAARARLAAFEARLSEDANAELADAAA